MILSLHINPCRSTIEAAEINDLTGNTDWFSVEVDDDTAKMLMNKPIHDEYGAAIYKFVDGAVMERHESERMQEWPADEPEPEPTAEERLAALESIIEAQARALAALGVTGDA